jgi:hypothetical protein
MDYIQKQNNCSSIYVCLYLCIKSMHYMTDLSDIGNFVMCYINQLRKCYHIAACRRVVTMGLDK